MNKKERKWLAEARELKNLTQKELGKLVGVSDNAITQYEKGIRFPKPAIAIRIAKELNFPISKFYESEVNKNVWS